MWYTRNKSIASRSKGITSSNKKLLGWDPPRVIVSIIEFLFLVAYCLIHGAVGIQFGQKDDPECTAPLGLRMGGPRMASLGVGGGSLKHLWKLIKRQSVRIGRQQSNCKLFQIDSCHQRVYRTHLDFQRYC